jgi:hypothetical protein
VREEGCKPMALMTVKIQCADIEEVKDAMNRSKNENARLKLQLGKVLGALAVGVPCPNAVNLPIIDNCDDANCAACWHKALDTIEVPS